MLQKKTINGIKNALLIFYLVSMSFFILVYMVVNALFQWFQLTFCAKFVQIMYTIRSPLKGADKQIDEFITWCQLQPWYEDTVIVILGDHPRMDNSLVEGADYVNRTVYNYFINTEYDKDNLNLKNRVMTTMDLYPTILASMGFSIPNDMLGIGTNLFSDKPTLAEQMGYETFNNEMKKYSSFYIKKCS